LLAWQELATSYRELIQVDWARCRPFFFGAFFILRYATWLTSFCCGKVDDDNGFESYFMRAYYSKLWKWLRNRKVQGNVFLLQ